MREIKFRVWNEISKEYTYFATPILSMDKKEGYPLKFLRPSGQETKVMLTGYGDLEQSTGLQDKNGKEIYWENIVRKTFDGGFEGSVVGVVKFKPTKGYYLDCSHTKQVITKTIFDGGNFVEKEVVVKLASLACSNKRCEIISTIHDKEAKR